MSRKKAAEAPLPSKVREPSILRRFESMELPPVNRTWSVRIYKFRRDGYEPVDHIPPNLFGSAIVSGLPS
jgi:hypothetical protein